MEFVKTFSSSFSASVRLIALLIGTFVTFVVLGVASSNAAEAVTEAQVLAWITQLGDHDFSSRQEANRQLLESGVAALPQLRKAVDHPDRELSHRARRLVTFLEQLQRRRLLDAFASADNPGEFEMPCWNQFKQTMGELPAIQPLFAEMLRQELELLQTAADGTEQEFYAALDARVTSLLKLQLSGDADSIEIGSLCAFYFCSTLRNFEYSDASDMTTRMLVSVVSLPQIELALRQGEQKEAISRLVSIAIFENENIEDSVIFGRNSVQVAVALPRARRLVAKRNEIAFLRHRALLVIVQFGGEDDVKLLESLFDDESILRNTPQANGTVESTTIGDVALQVALKLTDKKPIDIGISNDGTFSFSSQEDRDASRVKWRELRDGKQADKNEKTDPEKSNNESDDN